MALERFKMPQPRKGRARGRGESIKEVGSHIGTHTSGVLGQRKFDNLLIPLYNTINKSGSPLVQLKMMRKRIPDQKSNNKYSKSFSNLHHPHITCIDLKEFYLRKSIFNPPQGLAESYASRNRIPGAEVPSVEVVYSDNRWLLLQSPRLTHNVFSKINSGVLGNPYELVLRLFKSMVAITRFYGFFLVTSNMSFLQNRQVRVWINEDIFSNSVQIPLKQGKQGEKEFVLSFLLLLEKELEEWERVTNIFTIEETLKLLEWRNKINCGNLTVVQASKDVFSRPDQSYTSFEPNELKYYGSQIKGCMSMQDIAIPSHLEYLNSDLSSSYTIKEEEKLMFKKSMNRNLLYDEKDMKNSIDCDFKHQDTEVRKTKKKFNLTSTSSTLEQFSDKLASTIGRKALRLKYEHLPEKQREVEGQRKKNKNMHKSQPISIVNELDGLFEDDEKHQFRLGEEGDREQLEKIAEEIEQILIW